VSADVRTSVSGAPSRARVARLLDRAGALTRPDVRRLAGGSEAEVSILFCGDARMRALNRRYRRFDRSTDVLAFPAEGEARGLLGDIVVSMPYAARQARRRAEPLGREVDRLVVHGFLHLLGYDHEVDDGEMDALEARLRFRLGIAEAGSPRAGHS
jgi:rRNA maturation RNase YbeY